MELVKKAPSVDSDESYDPHSYHDTSLSIGELFSQTRRQKKKSIENISSELCIRTVYLKAIEEMDLQNLPEPVYTLGFVRSYARHLQLNEEEAVQRFKKEVMGVQPEKTLNFPKTLPTQGAPKNPLVFLSLLVFIGLLSWLYTQKHKKEDQSQTLLHEPSSPEPSAEIEIQKETLQNPPMETPPAPPLPKEASQETSSIVLKAESRSWVEIIDKNGQVILNRIFNPGESYNVPPLPGLVLNTGNAGGIQIIVEGKVTPSLGQYGMPRRHISLDREKLTPLTMEPSEPSQTKIKEASKAPSLDPETSLPSLPEKRAPENSKLPGNGPISSKQVSTENAPLKEKEKPSQELRNESKPMSPKTSSKPTVKSLKPTAAPKKPVEIMPPVVSLPKSMDLIPEGTSEGIGSIS